MFGIQGDLNLNICEAHAFNTLDKFSLDVFVVNGWKGEVGWLHTNQLQWQHFHVTCCQQPAYVPLLLLDSILNNTTATVRMAVPPFLDCWGSVQMHAYTLQLYHECLHIPSDV